MLANLNGPVLAVGSNGGLTASVALAGTSFRARTSPTIPASRWQWLAWESLRNASKEWKDLLNATQRFYWNQYATGLTHVNKAGCHAPMTGHQAFVRQATPAKTLRIVYSLNAPVTSGYGTFTTPSIVSLSGRTLSVAITESDPWTTAAGGWMQIQLSHQVNPTKLKLPGKPRTNGAIVSATTAYMPGHRPIVVDDGAGLYQLHTIDTYKPPGSAWLSFSVAQGDGRWSDAVEVMVNF